jgi:hypothetical protein
VQQSIFDTNLFAPNEKEINNSSYEQQSELKEDSLALKS